MIPRCDHDRIILGCPDPDCEKQNAYLAEQDAALERWLERQRQEAREIVRLLMEDNHDGPHEPTLDGEKVWWCENHDSKQAWEGMCEWMVIYSKSLRPNCSFVERLLIPITDLEGE